jgi:hypothetical protein
MKRKIEMDKTIENTKTDKKNKTENIRALADNTYNEAHTLFLQASAIYQTESKQALDLLTTAQTLAIKARDIYRNKLRNESEALLTEEPFLADINSALVWVQHVIQAEQLVLDLEADIETMQYDNALVKANSAITLYKQLQTHSRNTEATTADLKKYITNLSERIQVIQNNTLIRRCVDQGLFLLAHAFKTSHIYVNKNNDAQSSTVSIEEEFNSLANPMDKVHNTSKSYFIYAMADKNRHTQRHIVDDDERVNSYKKNQIGS